ncbi:amino acid ABC transporter permease [Nocardioides marmotae]|uniref:amino acid ABC transporter permease n=1 Tax=Nocardioides marmotae TaxID=2663857 RepID=UPI0012B5D7D5|nr:amino acid ABC transporter permease [Nocardioides marmotae]MBC9732490.1 amino acid ABC transporter permease [Nocardioides marmotae]MTB83609.1 ABC transporter permease subunit [Nocardioides marmotae]
MTETPAPGWTPSPRELERRSYRRRRRIRSQLIATGLVALVLVALVVAVRSSPGWPNVRELFFSWEHAREAFPAIASGFWLNVKLFLICEVLILVLGLLVALARVARSPWLAPIRVLAVVYTDLLRGVPTLLLVLMLGFGMPALGLQGVPISGTFWAGVALVLSYSAYVSEVFRAGIDSVHPSQVASAQALGLSRPQALRHVVVPQAVRRVVPPLLNDFVSLQKDTALVSAVAVFDAVFAARDYAAYNFNYTPYVVVAAFFVVLTVPLARLTDWLQRRWLARERAGQL